MKTNKTQFDNSALRQRILEQYGTIKAFAKTVEMHPSTLSDKLNGRRDFHHSEIVRIKTLLNLDEDETDRFFFTPVDFTEFADLFLKMSKEKRSLLLRIIDLAIGNPARMDTIQNWKGKMKDLPAILAKI